MPHDVAAFRQHFPALQQGVAWFDGPGGTQVPRQVAHAVASTMAAGLSNRGRATESQRRADDVVVGARAAMADLLGCDPGGVVFARSMTQVTYDVARALAKGWAPGDQVVVSRLDHDANVRPWLQVAERAGVEVGWAGFDRETGELTVEDVRAAMTNRTRLVAVTGASNVLGTRPDLPAIADAVHDAGALLFVDGVHLTPHAPVDVAALGADLYACSPYKFFGPHLGVLAAAPSLLEQLHPDKLVPSTDQVPERFELGTLPYELLAGTTAAVEVIADVDGRDGDRRARVLASMQAVEEHEAGLAARLLDGLRQLPGVTVHGRAARRTPTVFFTVDGRDPAEVSRHLAGRGVNAPAGSFYAVEPCRWIGIGDAGAVRAGCSAYTDDADVDRLLEAMSGL